MPLEKSREELLAMVPPGAIRVKVTDESGATKYRNIEEDTDTVLPTDKIAVNSNGEPVTMSKALGRPRTGVSKGALGPKAPPNPAAIRAADARAAFLKKDRLLKAIQHSIDSDEVLSSAMVCLGEEAALLAYERKQEEEKNLPTAAISARRLKSLKSLVDAWFRRRDQMTGKTIDLAGPAFAQLFEFMVETFKDAMIKGGIPEDQADVIFTALSEQMSEDTWEMEARQRMKVS